MSFRSKTVSMGWRGFFCARNSDYHSLILNNFLFKFSTVYEDQLAKHLKKCNSREKPKPVSVWSVKLNGKIGAM